MRKKLICILVMLAGIAVIAGLILFSSIHSGNDADFTFLTLSFLSLVTVAAAAIRLNEPDEESGGKKALLGGIFIVSGAVAILLCFAFIWYSPNVINTLVFFIIVAITAATWFRHVHDKPDELELTRRGMVFLQVFRVVGILTILVSLAFMILIFFLVRDDIFGLYMRGLYDLMELPLAGIVIASLSLKLRAPVSGRGIGRAARCVPIVVAVAITAALGFIYLNYLPKYSLEDGMNMLRSDEEFAQSNVYYDGGVRGWGNPGSFGVNPFYGDLYGYNCGSYSYDAGGLHITKGYILFNPATGTHEYTPEQERTYSPGDWPEFNYNLIYDKDGQHNAVMNLYFWEESWLWGPMSWMNQVFPVSSGKEWNEKMEVVMVPHNFPEDEARAFLRNTGEEAMKTKLLEQINGVNEHYHSVNIKDMTIDLFFFGIDIGTYQNGEVVLKP